MASRVVISAVDDNYVLPLLVMIHSAKKYSKNDFRFVLGYDPNCLSATNINLIEECLTLLKVPFSKICVTLKGRFEDNNHITATAYARLPMADVLSGTVLWLDADLVCKPGWDEIFEFFDGDLGGKTVAGVRDSVITSSQILANTKNLAVIKMQEKYFNSGVLIIDCISWQLMNTSERWPVVVQNYDNFGFQLSDQCVLNYLFADSHRLLPPEYNVLAFYSSRTAREQAKILHFAGPMKPWSYRRFSFKIFFSLLSRRDIWDYLDLETELLRVVLRASRGNWKLLHSISHQNKKEKWVASYKKNAHIKRALPPKDHL
jgi:lipopolysaccharide biosynthesis glycosyltransferase